VLADAGGAGNVGHGIDSRELVQVYSHASVLYVEN
jgi:hypothetical protein